ncbi:spermatogenesis- and oogenesis-specific basic helix-loop-helix-containing protein 1 [Phyllostomus hastatus]|uniref:spermatogenesis- and oogenesis-specific basic helix-loop-helix-containing protein 1 n=1 Tax=Phyllostomus hastatus TaxID=9423 RepID=UPI001E6852B5|nr:spermatogenesis- and oogenesis-specific basic helix-loop-helix-containing protein 1 [Phyllostomus hastatus]
MSPSGTALPSPRGSAPDGPPRLCRRGGEARGRSTAPARGATPARTPERLSPACKHGRAPATFALRTQTDGRRQGTCWSLISSSSSRTGAQFHRKDPAGGSAPVKNPVAADGPASCLPRNVLSERERRKRISVSCERLRALLPQFEGRREDMASVLEMSVLFLRFASPAAPGGEQQAVKAVVPPSEDVWWHRWQEDVLQLALAHQSPASAPGPGKGAPVTMQQDPPSCVTTGGDRGKAPTAGAEVRSRPAAPPGPCGLAPRTPGPNPSKVLRAPPAWPPCSRQPAAPLMSGEAQSCLGQAGPLAEGTDQAVPPGTRCMPACDVEDGLSFPLTASPDWWLGSLEGRANGALAQAPARSSPLDRTEPGFLADPEPGSQELPDGALEAWGWDMGCASLALRDEGDGIFPDFLAY